jgi:hypothetical protein
MGKDYTSFDTMFPLTVPSDVVDERGVRFEKGKGKWRVRITFQAKEYHLGYYTDKESALKTKREAEAHFGSDFVNWFNNTFKNAGV